MLRDGWRNDVVWYFLSSLLPVRLLALPVAALVWMLSDIAPRGLWPALGELPSAPRFVLALAVAELGAYWGHRWMHASPRLWRFHAIHHGATALDWLVNTRAHPVDLLVTRLCALLPLYALGLAQPQRGEPDWVPLAVTLVASLWGYLLHANLDWRLGWLEQVVASPAFHHWHHEHLGAGGHGHANFAAFLPVLDRLFGTLKLPRDAWPQRYGTDEPVWPTLVDQLLAPFMGSTPAAEAGTLQREPEA
jgi:sterol desaturase/sphingolipid hydroxylase (fatty acid hydroxylase superfamily)